MKDREYQAVLTMKKFQLFYLVRYFLFFIQEMKFSFTYY